MKKMICILTLCLLILSSCQKETPQRKTTDSSNSDFDSVTETSYSDYIYSTYLDRDITHEPTKEEVLELDGIKMPAMHLLDLIGKPHNIGHYGSVTSLRWELEGDYHCYFRFELSRDLDVERTAENFFLYGECWLIAICPNTPTTRPPKETTKSPETTRGEPVKHPPPDGTAILETNK